MKRMRFLVANPSYGLSPGLVEGLDKAEAHTFKHETCGRSGVNLREKEGFDATGYYAADSGIHLQVLSAATRL